MDKKAYFWLDLVNVIVSFLVCRYVFMEYLYVHYHASILTFSMPERDVIGPLSVILIMTYSLFVLLSFFYRKKIRKNRIRLLYTLYFLCLSFLLLFKSIGIKGIVINPLETFQDMVSGNAFVPLMNSVLFVPLGMLFTTKRQIFLAGLGVIGVELAQYCFSIGIFDTGDIVLNVIGMLIGMSLKRLGLLDFFLQKID